MVARSLGNYEIEFRSNFIDCKLTVQINRLAVSQCDIIYYNIIKMQCYVCLYFYSKNKNTCILNFILNLLTCFYLY